MAQPTYLRFAFTYTFEYISSLVRKSVHEYKCTEDQTNISPWYFLSDSTEPSKENREADEDTLVSFSLPIVILVFKTFHITFSDLNFSFSVFLYPPPPPLVLSVYASLH